MKQEQHFVEFKKNNLKPKRHGGPQDKSQNDYFDHVLSRRFFMNQESLFLFFILPMLELASQAALMACSTQQLAISNTYWKKKVDKNFEGEFFQYKNFGFLLQMDQDQPSFSLNYMVIHHHLTLLGKRRKIRDAFRKHDTYCLDSCQPAIFQYKFTDHFGDLLRNSGRLNSFWYMAGIVGNARMIDFLITYTHHNIPEDLIVNVVFSGNLPLLKQLVLSLTHIMPFPEYHRLNLQSLAIVKWLKDYSPSFASSIAQEAVRSEDLSIVKWGHATLLESKFDCNYFIYIGLLEAISSGNQSIAEYWMSTESDIPMLRKGLRWKALICSGNRSLAQRAISYFKLTQLPHDFIVLAGRSGDRAFVDWLVSLIKGPFELNKPELLDNAISGENFPLIQSLVLEGVRPTKNLFSLTSNPSIIEWFGSQERKDARIQLDFQSFQTWPLRIECAANSPLLKYMISPERGKFQRIPDMKLIRSIEYDRHFAHELNELRNGQYCENIGEILMQGMLAPSNLLNKLNLNVLCLIMGFFEPRNKIMGKDQAINTQLKKCMSRKVFYMEEVCRLIVQGFYSDHSKFQRIPISISRTIAGFFPSNNRQENNIEASDSRSLLQISPAIA